MSDSKQGAAPLTGDATSQLVQITARDIGMKQFKSSGNGAQDIRRIIVAAHNLQNEVLDLWATIQDLCKLIDAEGDKVPESFRAAVTAGILRVRSNKELGNKS